jgi:hypothetical protein
MEERRELEQELDENMTEFLEKEGILKSNI